MVDYSYSIHHTQFLVTGTAGFIGYHISKKLLELGYKVTGIDNLNDYYDISLKKSRLQILQSNKNFSFIFCDISNRSAVDSVFIEVHPDIVINLAAQAGVRYSIDHPEAYIQSNIIGFFNILEACRHFPVYHLLYASSSSVYGSNTKVPFEETDKIDNPISLYASTKITNELMAKVYSNLYQIPSSGLRFFTVYGPYGRPDMAYFDFLSKYFSNRSISIFNNGDLTNDLFRDFTYIDDVIDSIYKLVFEPPKNDKHTIYNIGNNHPVKLMDFVYSLESALSQSLGREVIFKKVYEPIKPGDVLTTYASTERLSNVIGYKPHTDLRVGLQKFTDWFVNYYNCK